MNTVLQHFSMKIHTLVPEVFLDFSLLEMRRKKSRKISETRVEDSPNNNQPQLKVYMNGTNTPLNLNIIISRLCGLKQLCKCYFNTLLFCFYHLHQLGLVESVSQGSKIRRCRGDMFTFSLAEVVWSLLPFNSCMFYISLRFSCVPKTEYYFPIFLL